METQTEKHGIHPRQEACQDHRAIRELLLISSEYHIYTMESDGHLAYTGEGQENSISCPPRITGVSCAKQAMGLLKAKRFDLVVIIPDQTDPLALGRQIKEIQPGILVALLAPGNRDLLSRLKQAPVKGIDWTFTWSGNPKLFLSVIQLAQDHLRAQKETGSSRVVILVEDSPEHAATLLPMVHREVAAQTRILVDSLTKDRQKLAAMEARPKVLLAATYEQAMAMATRYRSCLLCVISDTRLPRAKKADPLAGIRFLSKLRRQDPGLPLLLMSTETQNRAEAMTIPALFLDKNTPRLNLEIQRFFQNHLGFGDFVFRSPFGEELGRAWDMESFEQTLSQVPEPVFLHLAGTRQFSAWLSARGETELALAVTAKKAGEFTDPGAYRGYILNLVRQRSTRIQQGLGSHFDPFRAKAPVPNFSQIGHGSVGGKARGLAFMAHLLSRCPDLRDRYPGIRVSIPKTLVICTDIFEAFVRDNHLGRLEGCPVLEIVQGFLDPPLPGELTRKLEAFVLQVKVPLAVRSSSQLEDDRFHACAGLYKTYKIPNNHTDLSVRLDHLVTAVKLVWASAYYRTARTRNKNISGLPLDDTMAVMIQELAGREYGDHFYPALSGTAQSANFYPVSPMTVEDGVVHLALGLGRTVTQGETCFRFCPKYPAGLPWSERSGQTVQTRFYALRTKGYPQGLRFPVLSNLEHRSLADALEESPVKALASTGKAENQGRPTGLTFNQILTSQPSPLPGLISQLLALGKQGLGGPVEMEFAADLPQTPNGSWEFSLLQIRPMAACSGQVKVSAKDLADDAALCVSSTALGHGLIDTIRDIILVRPEKFKGEKTPQMAREISRINARLEQENRPFLLAGPGQWGHPSLGIPVHWSDISGARAIVEIRDTATHDGSGKGSHFFHNIAAMGIPYITVNHSTPPFGDRFCPDAIEGANTELETDFIEHLRLPHPLTIKLDGRGSRCVILGRQTQTNTMAA